DEEIVVLLEAFVASKHNGMVSGKERELSGRIRRAVKSASRIDRAKDQELFARIRQARQRGRYRRVIRIAPLLRGENQEEEGSKPTSSCLFTRADVRPAQVDQNLQTAPLLPRENQQEGSKPPSLCLFVRTDPQVGQIAQDQGLPGEDQEESSKPTS